eukprot:gene44034-36894_t
MRAARLSSAALPVHAAAVGVLLLFGAPRCAAKCQQLSPSPKGINAHPSYIPAETCVEWDESVHLAKGLNPIDVDFTGQTELIDKGYVALDHPWGHTLTSDEGMFCYKLNKDRLFLPGNRYVGKAGTITAAYTDKAGAPASGFESRWGYSKTGVLNLVGKASVEDYGEALKRVVFKTTAGMGDWPKKLSYALGVTSSGVYDPRTEHFYDSIQWWGPNAGHQASLASPDPEPIQKRSGLSWDEARVSCEEQVMFGQPGYLATLTDSEESHLVSDAKLTAKFAYKGQNARTATTKRCPGVPCHTHEAERQFCAGRAS